MPTQRRSVLKKLFTSLAGVAGFGAAASAMEILRVCCRSENKTDNGGSGRSSSGA